MTPTRFLTFTIGLLLLGSCRSSNHLDSETGLQQLQLPVNRASLSDSLAQLFVRFHRSGSIIVRGRCTDAGFIADEVPSGPTGTFSNFDDALAEWSREVPRLRLSHDTDGMWRVVDNTASAELLRFRIHDLRAEVFDSGSAVDTVLGTSEVKQFLRDNGISQASTMGGLGPYDASKLPHSPWHLHDVTVKEAFDAVVEKYLGVWVYTECALDDHHNLMSVRTLSF